MSFEATASSVEWTAERPRAAEQQRIRWQGLIAPLAAVLLLGLCVGLNVLLTQRMGTTVMVREELRQLPRGEVLKRMVLGYDQLAADILWLNIVQVLGEPEARASDYEWLSHALDVVTTLNPHYVYAYDVGGVVLAELAGRVDWSNALLEKGLAANPEAWRLPFQLGFNAFFHQQDYVCAADYMALAARLPGRPAYVPELASRLYVEGRQPALALRFLDAMAAQTQDVSVLAVLERRKAEVLIERDLEGLDQAVQRFVQREGHLPSSLEELVRIGLLATIPAEPFGGTYDINPERYQVVSSTHPQRMHLYRAADAAMARLP
jgi:hypothetical protein